MGGALKQLLVSLSSKKVVLSVFTACFCCPQVPNKICYCGPFWHLAITSWQF